jgi:hypothetical protein
MKYFRVINWDKYQGETKKTKTGKWVAPWFKFHHTILDDFDFSTLSEQDRFLWVGILCLARRTDNHINADTSYIKHQLRINRVPNLKPFQELGMIEFTEKNDSGILPEDVAKASRLEEEKRREKKRREERDEKFLIFWESYPKKVKKPDAKTRWDSIKYSPDIYTKIIEALQEHKKQDQWTRDNGQYIPHPSTWLNQGMWDDEIEASTGMGANGSAPDNI